MKKGFLFILFGCLCLSIISCGPRIGKPTTEKREVTETSFIDISAPVDATITIQQGAQPYVYLKGHPTDLKKIKTEMKDGVLRIYSDEDIHFGMDDVKAEIMVSSLSQLELSGASDVKTVGRIAGPSFTLNVSGAGDIEIADLNTENLTIDASGAADITIKSGKVKNAQYEFSGAGDLKAYGLQSDIASASVSGAGDIKLNVTQQLSAEISGAGSIKYKGHPVVTSDVSGIGSISDGN